MLLPQTSSQKRLSLKAVLALSVLVLGVFIVSSSAHALTISPARVELSGDPGATVGGEFTLINEQSTTQTFYPSYENFSAQGETGTPEFSSDKSDLDTWISVPQTQITILPGQVMKVPYTIAIPKDADPGGYFAALFWSTTPPSTESGQVSIGAKIGMLILLTVNGNVRESAGITEFDRDGHGFFYQTLPVTLRYKFYNAGGDRVQPQGTLTVRDTVFLPAAHLNANIAVGNILPNSTRQFTIDWVKNPSPTPPEGFFANVAYQWQNFAIGLYSAHLNLAYGTKGLHVAKTAWFFVFPWQLALCIFVVLFIVWWGGKTVLVRYNRYIIRKAQAGLERPSHVDTHS
jgi:hypothetical protein